MSDSEVIFEQEGLRFYTRDVICNHTEEREQHVKDNEVEQIYKLLIFNHGGVDRIVGILGK